MKRLLFAAALSALTLPALADEGMWMLTDLKRQNEVAMQELGLLIPADSIYNPEGIALKDAVVHFGGGCTGEVISAEGLVLTNHHCGYGAIQQHSSVEHDYLNRNVYDRIISEAEEEYPHCEAYILPFYNNNVYYLIVYKKYRDIRFVAEHHSGQRRQG